MTDDQVNRIVEHLCRLRPPWVDAVEKVEIESKNLAKVGFQLSPCRRFTWAALRVGNVFRTVE
jgi:hypothetical protein